MKHLQIALLTLFLFSLPGLKAQQNHFIYVQTENKQPFYVKLDKKIYSSSGSGYLVVPKLKEGTYSLSVGFPKSEWAEQSMVCTIDQNDIGYVLKNFGAKGWGLFNLQTSSIIRAGDNPKAGTVEVINKTDAFSNMLSNVVNDSTIRQSEIVKEEVKKTPAKEEQQSPGLQTTVKDSVANSAVTGVIEKSETIKEHSIASSNIGSTITRTLFNSNAEGTEMVFIDEVNGEKDTVRVFIPTEKKSVPIVLEEKSKEIEKPKDEPKPLQVKQEKKVKDTRFLEIEIPNPDKKTEEKKPSESKITEIKEAVKTETQNPVEKPAEQIVQKAQMINSDCKNFASPEDFLKLRKKMVAEDNDEDMITLAKKSFKTRCFTVEQVKNLSVLFLKDSGKYAFFDMAYPFVSDSYKFSTLKNQLSEAYYINRFEVMIRH